MNTVTPDDIDAVADRLSWRDDDIVAYSMFKGTEVGSLAREAFMRMSSFGVLHYLALGGIKIARPCETKDNVLFTPDDHTRFAVPA